MNCLGKKKFDAEGTPGAETDGVVEVTWEETNPLAVDGGEYLGLMSELGIDDEHLVEHDIPTK